VSDAGSTFAVCDASETSVLREYGVAGERSAAGSGAEVAPRRPGGYNEGQLNFD